MRVIAQTLLHVGGEGFEVVGDLAAVARAGIDAHALLRTTLAAPLPDDHAASALWWRVSRHLAPAVAAQADIGNQHRLSPVWVDHLTDSVGEDRAAAMQISVWWPALVTVVDHALARGQTLEALLSIAGTRDPEVDLDDAQAMVWRVSLLTEPTPADDTAPPPPEEHDNDLEWLTPTTPGIDGTAASHHSPADPDDATTSLDDVYTALNAAAVGRAGMGVLEPTPAEVEAMVAHAAEWDDAPFTPQRAAHINGMARDYYAERLDTAWGGTYLRDRLRTNQAPPGAGYVPAGWAHLVMHLRTRGVSDDEMLAVGLVTRARTGRLIDRFRDRLVLPISADDTVVGFVARRHPDAGDEHGPKYLNTPTTPLFHKGDVLYGVDHQLLGGGAVPVLVEGPLDALAVTTATGGRYLGVAPLGTSLTQTQARLLATLHPSPIVATDADNAGRTAAERAYWLLTQHAVSPRTTTLPESTDPADLLHACGPDALALALSGGHALAQQLIDNLLARPLSQRTLGDVAALIAADTPALWMARAHDLTNRTDAPPAEILTALEVASTAWNRDPAYAAQTRLQMGTQDHVLRPDGSARPPDPDVAGEGLNSEFLPQPMSVHEGAPYASGPSQHRADRANWPTRSRPRGRAVER